MNGLPFSPLVLPFWKSVLHCGVRWFIILWCRFVLLGEYVVVDLSADLNGIPRSSGGLLVFWMGSVLVGCFNHSLYCGL